MSTIIPPARIRQEDEFFIHSLAHTYANPDWAESELRSITADALRMIRHLSTRYSDPTCVELNGEELEAEGRKKFIEQFTHVRVLLGLPQRLHKTDVITAFNGEPVSSVAELESAIAHIGAKSVVIDYLRWPAAKKDDDDSPPSDYMKRGQVKFMLGADSTIKGVVLSEMDHGTRTRGAAFKNFIPLGVVVKEADTDEPLLRGRVPRPPTRGELFMWLKSCINNHIRGIVHRCRFTVRRTGRKVPAKDSKLDWNRSFKPEVSLEAASEDDHLNRAVERAASVLDSTALVEFDEDMGLSRYARFEISHPDNSTLTVADLSRGLQLNPNDLPRLAESYRRRIPRLYTPRAHESCP